MDESYFRKVVTIILITILLVLSFFLLRPILLSIIIGFILVFIFAPLNDWFNKFIKSRTLCVIISTILLFLIIFLPLWFLTPLIIDEAVKFYLSFQKLDLINNLKNIFPSFFSSEQFSLEIASALQSFMTQTTNSLVNSLAEIFFNLPALLLQFTVIIFTFFFGLRDKEKLISYIKGIMPFTSDVQKKLFDSTKGITASVLYGQIIIGMIQGIIAGLGFIIFGVPNALFFALLATLAGILPIIGPFIVWVPIAIYLFITGDTLPAIGIVIFGTASSVIDNFLRPIIVSKRTSLPTPLILIGMIGGLFLFGILGLILGPLIIAYLLIVLEIYRNKKSSSLLTT